MSDKTSKNHKTNPPIIAHKKIHKYTKTIILFTNSKYWNRLLALKMSQRSFLIPFYKEFLSTQASTCGIQETDFNFFTMDKFKMRGFYNS